MHIVLSLATLLLLGNPAAAAAVAASTSCICDTPTTWVQTSTGGYWKGCDQRSCGPGAACPVGFCDQRGLVNPTCDGGHCNQNSVSQADKTVNPTCDGIGWCDQRSSVNPSCNGGHCDQSYSANPSCIPDENCIEDGSRTYDANGNPRYHPVVKDSRLLAEEMKLEAEVDATMISSKNGSSAMTVSIATVFTVAAGLIVSSSF